MLRPFAQEVLFETAVLACLIIARLGFHFLWVIFDWPVAFGKLLATSVFLFFFSVEKLELKLDNPTIKRVPYGGCRVRI